LNATSHLTLFLFIVIISLAFHGGLIHVFERVSPQDDNEFCNRVSLLENPEVMCKPN